jgi:hypothetical protein
VYTLPRDSQTPKIQFVKERSRVHVDKRVQNRIKQLECYLRVTITHLKYVIVSLYIQARESEIIAI